jgi:hypothetical protein
MRRFFHPPRGRLQPPPERRIIFTWTKKELTWGLQWARVFHIKNSKILDITLFNRPKNLMPRLTDDIVLDDLLDPISRALARERHAAVGRSLTMPDLIALGILRQLQGMPTWREQV